MEFTKMNIIELAKECGFKPHIIHGGLIVKHSSGAWIDISSNLEVFANAVIENYKAGLVPAIWMWYDKPNDEKVYSDDNSPKPSTAIPLYALGKTK
jgi:hypothetical protein